MDTDVEIIKSFDSLLKNKGFAGFESPNYVALGLGFGANAVIIGDVIIADNCVIGAGAVVTKSFTEPGSVIVGVPGRKIN